MSARKVSSDYKPKAGEEAFDLADQRYAVDDKPPNLSDDHKDATRLRVLHNRVETQKKRKNGQHVRDGYGRNAPCYWKSKEDFIAEAEGFLQRFLSQLAQSVKK